MIKIEWVRYNKIVFLTGAGASVHLGFPTYEELYKDEDAFRARHIDVFRQDPDRTWKALMPFRKMVLDYHKAHQFNEWAQFYHLCLSSIPDKYHIITTNVDSVDPFGIGPRPIQYHGCIMNTECPNDQCDYFIYGDLELHEEGAPVCPECGSTLKPAVVLYGEPIPYDVHRKARDAIRDCDLFIAIGTSGRSGALSHFMRCAKFEGATTININTKTLDGFGFDHQLIGDATEILIELGRAI